MVHVAPLVHVAPMMHVKSPLHVMPTHSRNLSRLTSKSTSLNNLSVAQRNTAARAAAAALVANFKKH